jgi:hypothetical protein
MTCCNQLYAYSLHLHDFSDSAFFSTHTKTFISWRCVSEVQESVGYVQIWATMNNCAGVSRDVMLSQDALEAIVNKTLEQLRNPGLQCLNMVTTELMRITEECTPPEISRYSSLAYSQLSGGMKCSLSLPQRVPMGRPAHV